MSTEKIVRLVKRLKEAGAWAVEVKPDGTIRAEFYGSYQAQEWVYPAKIDFLQPNTVTPNYYYIAPDPNSTGSPPSWVYTNPQLTGTGEKKD